MRTKLNTLMATAAMTTSAYAASSPSGDEPGILAWAFLGFCAVILVGQAVPAAIMIYGAFKALVLAPKEVKKH